MRITANIIDEDGYALEKTCPSSYTQGKGCVPHVDKNEIYDDVIPRLRRLHLTEDSKAELPLCEDLAKGGGDACSKPFKCKASLNPKFADVPLNQSSSFLRKPLSFRNAFAAKPMEKGTGENPAGNMKIDTSAPLWLMHYLSIMKQQIKKEIMDEISPVAHCFKSDKVEESQADYQGEVIHTDIFCDNCDQLIHGIRYKCGNCADFDLCQECESLPNIHNKHHIFLKIRYPIALKLYQRQKWQDLVHPVVGKMCVGSRGRQLKKLYEAKFVCDETIPDSTVLPPSTKFVKSWKIINSGTRVWTHATKLRLIQGSADLVPSSEHVDVPHLKPGEEGIVSILLTSPSRPGLYRSHWNFCHKNRPFGDIVWCHIMVKQEEERPPQPAVVTPESSDATSKLSLDTLTENKQKEVSCIADVLTAVQKEHDRGNMVPRKLVVSSHTATPNNTPFDLTPPKSPDHHAVSAKKLHPVFADITPDENKDLKPPKSPDYHTVSVETPNLVFSNIIAQESKDSDDDDCSIVSLESSDSDTEFVVIPMPKCFNLSESFLSQHVPQCLPEAPAESSEIPATLHKMMQLENQEVGIISEAAPPPRMPVASRTVSQETGVPELSVIDCNQAAFEIVEDRSNTTHVSVISNGSSSEVSVIDSGTCSPVEQHITVENATQTMGTVNVSLSTRESSGGSEVAEITVLVDSHNGSETVAQQFTDNQDTVEDNPNSATFPKFPIEGITGTFDPSPVLTTNEERVVQVLPEGLVTGALSAAASVYNTARAVISTIQQPRNNSESCLSQELPPVAQNGSILNTYSTNPDPNPMDQLIEMGFCNRRQNEELLKAYKGDVNRVVAEFVNMEDNEWYASRHVRPPPPASD